MNLPSLAGAGHTICRGLLEGYDSKHRQDNSMIQVSVDIKLLAGDPCFKTSVFGWITFFPVFANLFAFSTGPRRPV